MPIGHKLGLRLFLEGIEIPVISASISVGANSPAVAAIQVIATDALYELFPRSLVHLFFYDFVDGVVVPPIKENESPADVTSKGYKLLFMGELQAISFAKDSGQRAATLQCVDFSNYWDTTYQYNYGGDITALLTGNRTANFIGANTNLLGSPLGHGTWTVASLLSSKCVSFPDMRGLLAGIVRMIEAIGGCYYGKTTFKGATYFHSLAELRLKLMQQVGAAAADTSTEKLLARKAFNAWMNRECGSLGKLVTFRELAGIIQRMVFLESYPCPAPKFGLGRTGLTKNVSISSPLAKDPKYKKLVAKLKELREKTVKTQSDFKVFQTHSGNSEAPEFMAPVVEDVKQMRNLAWFDLIGEMDRLKDKNYAIRKNLGIISLHTTYLYQLMPKQSGSLQFADALTWARQEDILNRLSKIIEAIDRILGMNLTKNGTITYDEHDRIYNQIFRPDIWFAPPPCCNVLFPECYSSFEWTRNYFREVTRLELQTTHEILGDDALFNGRYYAPNIEGMTDGRRLSSQKFAKFIMDHELYIGIIPMFEKLSQANLFAMKSRQVNYQGVKVPYAQRSVNFQYFKHRFASRQMSSTGRFNPYFVPGFPGLLVDKPMNLKQLGSVSEAQLKRLSKSPSSTPGQLTKAEFLRTVVPTQHLGCCVQISHQVGQNGGNTSYAFTEARVHRESSEFLGVDKMNIYRKGKSAKVHAVYATPKGFTPAVNMQGPRGGKITVVDDRTWDYAGKPVKLEIFRPASAAKKGKTTSTTKKSKEKKVGKSTAIDAKLVKEEGFEFLPGADSSSLPGKPVNIGGYSVALVSGDQSFQPNVQAPIAIPAAGTFTSLQRGEWNAFYIEEVVQPREKIGDKDIPIEEAVRPPWIWDGWKNDRIGDTYDQFFGTNSIVDVDGFKGKDLPSDLLQQAGLDQLEAQRLGSQSMVQRKQPTVLRNGKRVAKKGTKASIPANREESEDRKANDYAFQLTEDERYVEAAIDYLVQVYSYLKLYDLDVGSFIRSYTWRPIATLQQILGSRDFTLAKTAEHTYEVTAGIEGFHSRAFGDIADLFGLVSPKVVNILGFKKDNQESAVIPKLDVRRSRFRAALRYRNELSEGGGLLG